MEIKGVNVEDIVFEWDCSGGWRFKPPKGHPKEDDWTDTEDVLFIILQAVKEYFKNF